MRKIIILAIVLAAGGIYFFLRPPIFEKNNRLPAASGQVGKRLILEEQKNEEGEVNISVIPILQEGADFWNFEVIIDTHSVDLIQDMISVSTLFDERGGEYKPLVWDGSPPGGHHRDGTLRFKPIAPKPKVMTLKIIGVGGVQERLFKWNLSD